MRDQVSNPYKTTGKVIILYILIFIFSDSKLEDRIFWIIKESQGCRKPQRKLSDKLVPLFSQYFSFRRALVHRSSSVESSFFSRTLHDPGPAQANAVYCFLSVRIACRYYGVRFPVHLTLWRLTFFVIHAHRNCLTKDTVCAHYRRKSVNVADGSNWY